MSDIRVRTTKRADCFPTSNDLDYHLLWRCPPCYAVQIVLLNVIYEGMLPFEASGRLFVQVVKRFEEWNAFDW